MQVTISIISLSFFIQFFIYHSIIYHVLKRNKWFNQVFINVDSRDYGYFKIYLDAGKYNLAINKLNFNIDTSYFSYNIYDSNKNQIKESDVYNLESGYYYIYVTSQNRFPIVINKLD